MSTIVVGAGIVGASTAFELARRGEPVLLLDRGEVSGGTTGLGEGNVLAGDKDAGPELELDDRRPRNVRRARSAARRRGTDPPQGLPARPPRCAHVERRGRARRAARRGRRRRAPRRARRAARARAGVDGRACPARPGSPATSSATRARSPARSPAAQTELGCEMRTGTPVDEIAVEDGRVSGVRAGGELLPASTVVLAAGPWSGPLAQTAGLPLPLEPRKGQLTRLRPPEADERFLRHKIVDGGYLLSVESADARAAGLDRDRDHLRRRGASSARLASAAASTTASTSTSHGRCERAPPGSSPTSPAVRSTTSGSASAPGCPTTCRRSAPRAASRDCWSAPATRGPASPKARSPAACWPS